MSSKGFHMSKLLEIFKNLKSDAVPRAPRDTEETNDNNEDQPQVVIEDVEDEEVIQPEEKPKKQKDEKKKKSDENDEFRYSDKEKRDSAVAINVQATGPVTNIVNCSNIRLGDDYFLGHGPKSTDFNSKKYEEYIEKDEQICQLMKAKIKPTHNYMNYISKNLGQNWYNVFRAMGYTEGKIDTAKINAKDSGYEISEARYKLLLDWVNNDDDGTLGCLTQLLWKEGEKSIVKHLSIMYSKSKK